MSGTKSERTDDLPVIIHWLQQMQLEKWIDQELPIPHGNRQGLSYGQLAVVLLTYMISQADHRLCAVEPWVAQHSQSLEMPLGSLWLDSDTSVWHCWSERWLAICSYALRERLLRGFSQRLLKAEQALQKLASRPGKDAVILDKKATEISVLNPLQQQILVLMKIPQSLYLLPSLVPD